MIHFLELSERRLYDIFKMSRFMTSYKLCPYNILQTLSSRLASDIRRQTFRKNKKLLIQKRVNKRNNTKQKLELPDKSVYQ